MCQSNHLHLPSPHITRPPLHQDATPVRVLTGSHSEAGIQTSGLGKFGTKRALDQETAIAVIARFHQKPVDIGHGNMALAF